MKCKLKESIQLKIDVSIYLFFCWFYYFKVTRIRETMSLKLEILWGGTPIPPTLVWKSSLFSMSQGWQVWSSLTDRHNASSLTDGHNASSLPYSHYLRPSSDDRGRVWRIGASLCRRILQPIKLLPATKPMCGYKYKRWHNQHARS